eukprot:73506-Chlamydomonas_euryale.AAC.5
MALVPLCESLADKGKQLRQLRQLGVARKSFGSFGTQAHLTRAFVKSSRGSTSLHGHSIGLGGASGSGFDHATLSATPTAATNKNPEKRIALVYTTKKQAAAAEEAEPVALSGGTCWAVTGPTSCHMQTSTAHGRRTRGATATETA